MGDDRLFLTILRGSSPRDAEPVIATEDQKLIHSVARALGRRLGLSQEMEGEPSLELVTDEPEGEVDGGG